MSKRRRMAKQKTKNATKEMTDNYAPVQLEQAELAKQLERYIVEFETKVDQLKYKLLDKELVILFVANLHPRWKRLLEPIEHTFQHWKDAASIAVYHCVKVSALLGSERTDKSPLFTSQESIDILRSGYFASETHPDIERHPRESSIQHLIGTSTTALMPKKPATPSPPLLTTEMATVYSEKNKTKEKDNEKMIPKEHIRKPDAKEDKHKQDKKEVQKTEKKKAAQDDKLTKSKQTISSTTRNDNNIIETNNNTRNDSDSKENNIKDGNICYKIPECYKGVNLMFLELTINGKTVKGLLSKLSWGCSAISIDCVKRLGLTLSTSNLFCINTDFGIVNSLGFVKLPISHPAEPNIKSELITQVVPSTYNGKVELILGSDFFFKFKPTLNIKKRAIRFLDREASYIVHGLT
ncbi:hypothetical protein RMCBS344292_09302 [Rhizopus microsporus]|nr:hypothetical protein RMCBS344292_09302 [Rhizopus microsporus]